MIEIIEQLAREFQNTCYQTIANHFQFIGIVKALFAIGCKFSSVQGGGDEVSPGIWIFWQEWDLEFRGDNSAKLRFSIKVDNAKKARTIQGFLVYQEGVQENGNWEIVARDGSLSAFWQGFDLSVF